MLHTKATKDRPVLLILDNQTTVQDISPLPTPQPKVDGKRGKRRATQRSEILTSTPVKIRLESRNQQSVKRSSKKIAKKPFTDSSSVKLGIAQCVC